MFKTCCLKDNVWSRTTPRLRTDGGKEISTWLICIEGGREVCSERKFRFVIIELYSLWIILVLRSVIQSCIFEISWSNLVICADLWSWVSFAKLSWLSEWKLMMSNTGIASRTKNSSQQGTLWDTVHQSRRVGIDTVHTDCLLAASKIWAKPGES